MPPGGQKALRSYDAQAVCGRPTYFQRVVADLVLDRDT